MKARQVKTDLFGKFDPVLDAVLKSVTPLARDANLEKAAAQQPSSPAAQQPSKEVSD